MKIYFCDENHWIRVLSKDSKSGRMSELFGKISELGDGSGKVLYLYKKTKTTKKGKDFLMDPDTWVPLTIFDIIHKGIYRRENLTYVIRDWVFAKEA